MPARYGISTHLYHEQRLGCDHLLEMAEFGFRHVELFATIGHFNYHEASAIAELGSWLRDAGLDLHSVHAPIVESLTNGQWGPPLSTTAATESARVHAVQEAIAAVQIARQVPFEYLVVHLGTPDGLQATPDAKARDAARRSVEDIAAAASPLGVTVAIEVIPNRLSAAAALMHLLEDELELPPPGAGVCLDTGHAVLMGDLADAVDIVAGALVTTHVHDNRGRDDDHLVPFDGTIDWPAALMSLRKVGYEGLIMFELANTSTPRAVLEKTVGVRQRFAEILGGE